MSLQQGENVGDFVSGGQINRVVGWTMLVIGLASAAALDPWFFGAQSAIEFDGSIRPAARHAQGVVLGMALLQLAMAHLLATSAFDREVRQTAASLTTLGAAIYTAGYALGLMWPVCHGLVLVGSLINFSGFAHLLWVQPNGDYATQIRMILPMACFGMLLDFMAGLFQVLPEQFVLDYFGADDGVRLRMMRLARVAVIALSVLTLLYYGVARRAGMDRSTARWGGLVLACGAIGMPAILVAACFTSLYLKYVLALPATAVLVGVFLGLMFGLRYAKPLEWWGWALIAASTSVGMLMGLYAFDGPLGTPEFLGEYNETPRRLLRLAHSYCIVLGIMAIFLAREFDGKCVPHWPANLGIPLFVAGSAAGVGVLVMQIVTTFSTYALCIGPAVAVIGTVACLASCVQRT
jgi:hypothetical protein